MNIDLQLVEAHRKEAGAPDPVPLEEVEMPVLPVQAVPIAVGIPSLGGARPLAVMPRGVMPVVAMPSGAIPAGSPVSELRLIALFVAKWKLDPTRTKMVLFKLPSPKRRFVLDSFQATSGADATSALEQYVAKCASTNAWGAAVAATAAPAVGAPGALSPQPGTATAGLKRPHPTALATGVDAAKRPRLSTKAASPKPTGPTIHSPALQARLAAVGHAARPANRPAAPSTRPVLSAMGTAAPRPGMAAATQPAMGVAQRPGLMAVRPTSLAIARAPAAMAAASRPGLLAVRGVRPMTTAGSAARPRMSGVRLGMMAGQSASVPAGSRPSGTMAPRPKAPAARPGGLIADLLKRY